MNKEDKKFQSDLSNLGVFNLKKSEGIGYWIDSACGYLYVGYSNTLEEIKTAFLIKYFEIEL